MGGHVAYMERLTTEHKILVETLNRKDSSEDIRIVETIILNGS
jgi:hypothetical protein